MNQKFSKDILEQIMAKKRQEIAKAHKIKSLKTLESEAKAQDLPRGFEVSLRKNALGVIAEIKKASPSKGIICQEFDPPSIALQYEKAGAACLSVLTDESFFQGSNDYLKAVKQTSHLPVLRKDFMLDPYQIVESRALGADCVLLIVACLSDGQLNELHNAALALGMDVLVEVHTADELRRALNLSRCIIGINNRNLKTFKTSLSTTFELKQMIPASRLVVSESGINDPDDLLLLTQNGVRHFLIGERFMREPSPGQALSELLDSYRRLKLAV